MPDRAREDTPVVSPSGLAARGVDRPSTPDARPGPAVETFELYLTRRDGAESFEPLTCLPLEIVTKVRARLVDGGFVFADIRQAGRPLFILDESRDP